MASGADIIYKISAKDNISHVLDHANERAEVFHKTLERVESYAEIFGAIWGAEKVVEYFEQAGEKAHELELAELNLANTMQNMGTYSDESKEKNVAWAKSFSDNVKASTAEVIKLQANMQMVDGLTDDMAHRAIAVSAGIAAKMGTDIESAGKMLQRALVDPEQLGRVAKMFAISRVEQDKIEELGKAGHIAAARMELLAATEKKAGDFAQQAFNLDPLARYNKQMEHNKEAVGIYVEKLKMELAPALESISHTFASGIHWIGEHKDLIKKVGEVVGIVAGAYVAYNAVLLINTGLTKAAAAYTWAMDVAELAAAAETGLLTTAMWSLNIAMDANPAGILVAGIVAIAGAIYMAVDSLEDMTAKVDELGNEIHYDPAIEKLGKWQLAWKGIEDAAMAAGYAIAAALYAANGDMSGAKKNWEQAKASWQEEGDIEAGTYGHIHGAGGDWGDGDKRIKHAGETPTGDTAPKASKATGTKAITINIAINGGLVHEMKIITNTFGEAIEEIEQKVANVLLRAVNDASLHAAI